MPIIASLDIDAQKSFTPLCPTELPVPDGDKIVTALNAQAALAQYRLGSKDAHAPNPLWLANATQPPLSDLPHPNADRAWPSHCVVGTYGFELLDGLPAPEAYDYFVWKGIEPHLHPYGACFHDLHNTRTTGLIEYLHVKGVTVVIVGGLALDYCVKTTVLQLLHHGFHVGVNLSACRGLDPTTIAVAEHAMADAGAVLLPTVPAVEQWITTLI